MGKRDIPGKARLAVVVLAVSGLLAPAAAPTVSAGTPSNTPYYCLDGTFPTSWGIGMYYGPQDGKECYPTLDALYAAMGLPSEEFWNSLPSDVRTNVPLGGSFNAVSCSLRLPANFQVGPGEIFWGRCNNRMRVSFMGPLPIGGMPWWVPPPGLRAAQVQFLSFGVRKLWRLHLE